MRAGIETALAGVTSLDDDRILRRFVNLVEAAVRCFSETRPPLLLLVPPEGTRKEVERWKTGFYYIALGAEVPVVMAYMDHATRLCGVNRIFRPTGDLESDMTAIRAYYAPFRGWAKRHEARV